MIGIFVKYKTIQGRIAAVLIWLGIIYSCHANIGFLWHMFWIIGLIMLCDEINRYFDKKNGGIKN